MFGQLLLGMKNRPPHVRESGFWKEGNFRIWYIQNPENLSFGILIFGIRKTAQEEFGTPLTIRSGIQAPVTKNPESRTWNPEMYNLHSWSQDCLGSLTWGEAREGGMTIALPSLTFYGPPSSKLYNVLRYTYFIYTHFDPCLVFMNCGNEMKMISFPQFIYDLFHISLTLFLSREHMNQQLTCSQRQWLHSSVDRASHRYREVTGSNPVEVNTWTCSSLQFQFTGEGH